ncbi:MAG TPA: serine/threonine-protein kinase [Gemmataceae bacterium]|nr:serine/threonine-protein kinase [Gemmataceae bacterium]
MPPWTEEEREQRLDEVLACYLQALKEGAAPDRQELIDRHPELADDLAAFFADQDRFDRLAAPLRGMMPAAARLSHLRKLGDYEILEEIARGGMGVVFKAWQKSLGRVVALKMLLAGPWASPADLQRFRAEAEAAAQLDHPNIVPIHEVGTHDGHPYLSMKLVEGGSLAHHLATAESLPSNREAAALLAALADAIHYAHQHGILHRDLKPGNVLLASGTDSLVPMLTDFGLAKRAPALGPASRAGPAGAAQLAAPTETPTLPLPLAITHTGAILGTPGYMAPEQASGSPASVTTAADVYGLGAILYEMLTGRPPFQGDTTLDTVRQVLEQEPVRPSVYRPALDRDLETICLKCLQKEPHKRYASARELADDLRRFLRHEPILARPIGSLGRAWRLVRRRPLVSALTAALVVVLIGGLGSALALWRLAEQRREHAEQHARIVEQQRDELARAWGEAKTQRREAEHNLEDAESSFRLAHKAVDDFCLRVSNELRDTPALQPLRKALLQDALTYYRKFLERRGQDSSLRRELADTYQSVARITKSIGVRADARAAHEQALAIYRELQRDDPDNLALQRKLAGALNDAATYQDKTDIVAIRLEDARVVYDRFLARHPADWELRTGRALVLGNLAWAELQRGRLEAASQCYRQAREAQEQLLKERPKDGVAQGNLASTLSNYAALRERQHGGLADAVASMERVVELRDERARAAPQDDNAQADLAAALQNLCNILRKAGRDSDASKACQRAYQIRQELVQKHPLVPGYQAELASSHRLLGFFEQRAKHLDKALHHQQKARDIQKRLLGLDPSSPKLRRELSWSWFNVAALHGMMDQRPEEGEAYERARELQQELLRLDADNLDYHQDMVRTLNNLGWNRMAMKHAEEALPLLQEAFDHARLLLRRAPDNLSYRRTYSHALSTAAEAELRLGHTRQAAALVRERAKLWTRDAEEMFRVAHDMARTAGRVGGGKDKLDPQQRAERAAEVQDALEILRQSVALGFRDAARLQKDKAFASLHSEKGFRDLLGELKKQPDLPQK